jgi:hypothetical protein
MQARNILYTCKRLYFQPTLKLRQGWSNSFEAPGAQRNYGMA